LGQDWGGIDELGGGGFCKLQILGACVLNEWWVEVVWWIAKTLFVWIARFCADWDREWSLVKEYS